MPEAVSLSFPKTSARRAASSSDLGKKFWLNQSRLAQARLAAKIEDFQLKFCLFVGWKRHQQNAHAHGADDREWGRSVLPVMHRPIEFAIHRQVRSLIGELRRQILVDFNPQPRLVSWMHPSVLKVVGMEKDFVGLRSVPHVLLDTEVVHAQIEMQGGGHAYWT